MKSFSSKEKLLILEETPLTLRLKFLHMWLFFANLLSINKTKGLRGQRTRIVAAKTTVRKYSPRGLR